MGKNARQSGAVSLFAVIFGAMLLTIVTIGFIKLMIMDQQQSSNNDLSQSAYDAALAGVEDAKRVVRAAQTGNIQAAGVLNVQLIVIWSRHLVLLEVALLAKLLLKLARMRVKNLIKRILV